MQIFQKLRLFTDEIRSLLGKAMLFKKKPMRNIYIDDKRNVSRFFFNCFKCWTIIAFVLCSFAIYVMICFKAEESISNAVKAIDITSD